MAARRSYLGYRPHIDDPSLARREAIARMSLVGDRIPPLHSAVDLRMRGGRYFASRSEVRAEDPMARTIYSVLETTIRVIRDCPTLAIVKADIPPSTVGRCWLSSARMNVVVDDLATTTRVESACSIRQWHELHGRAAMKQWLATQGPLLTVVGVYEDLFAYAGGIYHRVCGELVGGHCLAVIGYDEASGCWLAQNSWGAHWGERGNLRIAFGECGVDASMWGIELGSAV